MTAQETFDLGMAAYDQEHYDTALPYFQSIAAENEEAQIFVPLCYLNIATEVSLQASASNDTETLVRGQQKAVSLLDAAIRTALNFVREHPQSDTNCAVAGMVLSSAFSAQYALVATGLTTAYRLTQTTTTIQKTMCGDTVLWEEIVGKDTEQYVSLVSTDMRDYHIFGPDEKTKRVQAQKETVRRNAVQAAAILTWLGREQDAHMLRAAVACEMADCENGDRSMLLAADWFIWQAQDVAKEKLSEEAYNEWRSMQDSTVDTYGEMEGKYAALLRSFRREGRKPALGLFYQPGEPVPAPSDGESYMLMQEAHATLDKSAGKGEWWEVFLSIFAQAATVRCIPTVVFSSVISLFMGGLFTVYSEEAGSFLKILGTVWLVITLVITLVRSATDSEGLSGRSLQIYRLIMVGIALLFATDFIVALVVFFVLKLLAKKYK